MSWYDGLTDDQIESAIMNGTAPGSARHGGCVEVPCGYLSRRARQAMVVRTSQLDRIEATLELLLKSTFVIGDGTLTNVVPARSVINAERGRVRELHRRCLEMLERIGEDQGNLAADLRRELGKPEQR